MLGIILVNYKSIQETIDYCKKELTKIKVPYVIVIVNNSATIEVNTGLANGLSAQIIDDDHNKMTHVYSNIFILPEKENLGFARGNNIGARFLLLNFPDIAHFLFTNNDLVFKSDDLIDKLLVKLNERKDIGIIGPKIIGINGKDQSPHRKMNIFSLIIFPKLFYPLLALLQKKNLVEKEVIDNAKEGVYYRIMGSFFICPKDYFINVGMFDDTTFLYGEELILSDRLRNINLHTYYLPEVIVIHNHGQTTSKYINSVKMTRILEDSLLYYFKEYRQTGLASLWLARFSFFIYIHIFLRLERK